MKNEMFSFFLSFETILHRKILIIANMSLKAIEMEEKISWIFLVGTRMSMHVKTIAILMQIATNYWRFNNNIDNAP